MKKIYFSIITGVFCLFFSLSSTSQVTVTNPTNITPNLAPTYASLSAAIGALNGGTSITGPVTITLNAGNPQTAPAGGYAITAILAGASATNTVTLTGSGNTITAFTPQANGLLYDAIFKIIGSDYITIQNFVMMENASNTDWTPINQNEMTEWGVALLRASATNGAQNNTIQNNTISLNRLYTNTFGIYSNVRHAAATPGTTNDITNVSGANSGNKIYNNTISNVNYGVVFIGSAVAARMDDGNDIGGSAAATGNTFTNWGTNIALSGYVDLVSDNYCIQVNHQINENVSYNTITSAVHAANGVSMGGILKYYTISGVPAGTFVSTINSNTVTLSKSESSGGSMVGINSQGMTNPLSTATITINNNSIINCAYTGGGSTTITGITNLSLPGTLNMSNNVVRSNTSNATSGGFAGITNSGAVVNTINITNNQIGNATGGAVTFSAATNQIIAGIINSGGAATTTVNLNDNIVLGISAVSANQIQGISSRGISGNAGVAINITNNNLGSATANFVSFSAATASGVFGFYNDGGVAATTVITISNNNIRGINHAVTASSQHQYISSFFAGATQNINNNTFTNLSVNTTGTVFFIVKDGNMTATGVENCSNNGIVTAFSKTAAGGSVFFYYSIELGVNGSTMTQTGNNFSNVTVTGATALGGWVNVDGASTVSAPTKTITGNTFSNITGGTGLINVMEINFSGNNSTVSNNTISNINGNGQVVGIIYGASNNQGTHAVSSNSISGLSSTAPGGLVIGISVGATTIPTLNVNLNTITGLSTTGASSAVIGLQITTGAIVNANGNLINTISGSGATSPLAAGITVAAGTTVNLGFNQIHTISQTAAIATTSPAVLGISLTGGVTVTAHNNFVANLNTPNANLADAIRGINVNSTTANSRYNLYYNSIRINTTSAGTNFGTSGVYHTTSATATTAALYLIDNIIVNTSTANGTGLTAAYRRSSATLTNFAATSNYNLFYAGTPSATNVIFYDGTTSYPTLAAYQAVAGLAPRDANSISALPNFTSATDLHLTPDNCSIDNKGTPIAGYTTDIDNQTRHVSVPDLGADEFSSTPGNILYNTVGTTVTDIRTVTATEIFRSPACELFARLQPNGGSPVNGSVTARVYKYATVQTFFGEPYLQRVIDITPASGGATATGRVTLYYTQQEFTDFNTASGPWPDLPTGPLDATGIANFRFTKYGGAPTVTPPAPYQYAPVVAPLLINPPDTDIVWNATDNRWEVTVDITGFSGFYVHTNNLFVLPITVNYLTGRKQGGNHLLNWKVTCNSTPRATMTLERSSDARNFTGIHTITADAARCNQPFDYTDANPLKGMNYYRLKMTDADGKITYSTTVALLNAVKDFDIISIAPNPVVTGNFKLNVASAQAGKMDISIFDMQGRLVNNQSITVMAGYNSLPVNVVNLSAGTYTIKGSMAGDQSKIIRFVKQ